MVKHSQTIRWQIADELFECVIGAESVKKQTKEIPGEKDDTK